MPQNIVNIRLFHHEHPHTAYNSGHKKLDTGHLYPIHQLSEVINHKDMDGKCQHIKTIVSPYPIENPSVMQRKYISSRANTTPAQTFSPHRFLKNSPIIGRLLII